MLFGLEKPFVKLIKAYGHILIVMSISSADYHFEFHQVVFSKEETLIK